MKYLKIAMLSALLSTNLVSAAEMVVRVPVEVKFGNTPSYDENGFDSDGIHQDTGTQFDPDGYNQSGVDSSGYTRPVCQYCKTKKIPRAIWGFLFR